MLEKVGEELELRLFDDLKKNKAFFHNILSQQTGPKERVAMEGSELTDHDGRTLEKISVQPIRSTSFTVDEIMGLMDTYELGKITPKESSTDKQGSSETRVVGDSAMSSPRTPTCMQPQRKSGKGKGEQLPDQFWHKAGRNVLSMWQ